MKMKETETEERRTTIGREYSREARCGEWQGASNGATESLSTTVDEMKKEGFSYMRTSEW